MIKKELLTIVSGLMLFGQIVSCSARRTNDQTNGNVLGRPQTAINLENERAELLALHKKDRRAHFETNPDLLVSDYLDSLISVRDGAVTSMSKDETRKTFEKYSRNAKYSEWDDIEPPIVRISNDATMAWIITHLRVRFTTPDASGQAKEEKFIYAGIMTYEKHDGKWIKAANVSTFE